MILTEDDKTRIKTMFSEMYELEEGIKSIRGQVNDLVAEISSNIGLPKKLIRRVYSFWKKKYEEGDDELDKITEVFVNLES